MKTMRKDDMKDNKKGLSQSSIIIIVTIIVLFTVLAVYISQAIVERNAFMDLTSSLPVTMEQAEIAKLIAEIRQIRSDTGGSLFWLKMIGLFITVGGAIGGYLIGQSQATFARLNFENKKNVDAAYQAIIQELSDDSPLLRSAAAVKLGAIMNSFPDEWNVSETRQKQLIALTKQVLAVLLSIEKEPKVLKTLTSAIAQHHPWKEDSNNADKKEFAELRELDLSGARAHDAYWARVDFTYTDFYQADLSNASLRKAILRDAKFRESNLCSTILAGADCQGAVFKFADLRNADLTNANLTRANFEGAKVFGVKRAGAIFAENEQITVDTSEKGDGSMVQQLEEWIKSK